ncbi:MAG: hypothetical protein ACI936_001737, partial [Paraglaciecola sp.]
ATEQLNRNFSIYSDQCQFKCWKSNKPYCETKYLHALKERNSPLLMTN